MRSRPLRILGVLAALASTVSAQPKDAGDKGDAKALLASGLKLYAAKDYLGALSVFQTAYARFPSPKILINIGTTLAKLDRKAEAANAYQSYLDSPDADPAKLPEVTKVLAGLDAQVARIDLAVTPADAEVQLDTGEWRAAAKLARVRVTPGAVTVRARKQGFVGAEKSVKLGAGESTALSLSLAAEPAADRTTTSATSPTDGGLRAGVAVEAPPGKLGFLALAHLDPKNKGGAGILGLAYDVTGRVQLQAAALVGPSSGAYAGATVALLTGKMRPVIAAGMPVFFSSGARVGIRAAAGVEVRFSRHLAAVAEVGVERMLNPEMSIDKTLVIPAVGLIGRL